MVKPLQTSAAAPWKQRYRAPVIWATQIAPHAPGRGLAASTQSGALQWYAWDVPSGALRQLTDRPGGMATYLNLSPDGQYIYYHDDKGVGNEIGHYVRIPYSGGESQEITPDLPPYSSFSFGVCRSGKRLGFMAADAEGFHIFVMDLGADAEPGGRRELYHSAQFVAGPMLSCDGDVGVVMTTERSSKPEFSLLAFDAGSGEKIAELWDGPDTSLEMRVPSPLAGDPRLLATTNRTGIETLLIWNPRTGERTDLTFEGVSGAIGEVSWSPDGQQIIFTVMTQAVQQLFLHDFSSQKTTMLNPPAGAHSGLYFTPDGKEIVSSWEDSTHPPQIITLDPLNGSKNRLLLKAGEVPAGRPWRWVSFPSTGGQMIQGWLGLPEGDGPFPTILETHGGPEACTLNAFSPEAQAWLDHGFAFLTINYHGSTTFGREFQSKIYGNPGEWEVEDMVAARDWLQKTGVAIADQVFLTGYSYGGYLTLLALGKYPDLWAAGMAGIAIADWAVQYEDSAETLRGYQKALFAGTPQDKPEQYAKSSPITYAERVKAPVLIIQGRNDTRTPARPVELYEAKMKALGKPIEVTWFDAGHIGAGADMERRIEHQERMMRFALQRLGL